MSKPQSHKQNKNIKTLNYMQVKHVNFDLGSESIFSGRFYLDTPANCFYEENMTPWDVKYIQCNFGHNIIIINNIVITTVSLDKPWLAVFLCQQYICIQLNSLCVTSSTIA